MRLSPLFIILTLVATLPSGFAAAAGNRVTYGNLDSHECYVGANMAHLSAESALPACNRALGFHRLPRSEKAATLVNRGILHTHLRNFDAAIADFDHALRLRPGFAEAHLNRGNASLFLGRFDLAVADYDAAIEGGTRKLFAAHYNRGLAREQLKQPKRALRDFRRAAELRPSWRLAADRIERYAGSASLQ
jgi:tetratricopeptide (TPR) repeat protein